MTSKTNGHRPQRLAVIIVSYNVCDLLRACLQSIYASAQQDADWLAVDVIVVDNASHDDSAQMVAAEFPGVHLLPSTTNLGFTRANNLALELLGFGTARQPSSPDFVLLLNPDTEVVEDALGKMARFLRDNPYVGACGPRLYYETVAACPSLHSAYTLQHAGFRYPNLAQIVLDLYPLAEVLGLRRLGLWLQDSRLHGRYPRRQWLGAAPFPVGFVLGAALMVRGETIRRIGLLDTGYFMYCEEMDWCLRMQEAGLSVFAVPAAQIIHHEARSSTQVRWPSFEQLWTSRFRFFRVHAYQYPWLFHALLRPLVRLGLAWNASRARRRFGRGELAGDETAEQLKAYKKIGRL